MESDEKDRGDVVGTFSIDDQKHIEVRNTVGVKRLVELLRGDDPLTKRDTLWILWKLSQMDDVKAEIRESDGIDAMIDCLESDSQEIRRYALRTLCNMSFDDASNVDIRLLGGIGPILDCLYPIEGAGEDVETTRAALRTLCNLSINDENKVEIRLQGGLQPIIDCLASNDIKTKRDALRTICNLSINLENKIQIRPLGGVRLILSCLQADDIETKRYALASLINLSSDEDNESEIRSLGGVRNILQCMHLDDVEVLRFSARSLCNLSVFERNKSEMGTENGVEIMLNASKHEDIEILCYSLATLMHICSVDLNCARCGELGGVEHCVELSKSREPEIRRYSLGLLGVLAANATNRDKVVSLGAYNIAVKNLFSKDSKTRKHAAKVVQKSLGTQSCISAMLDRGAQRQLIGLAADSDPEISLIAMECLYAMSNNGKEFREAIAQADTGKIASKLVDPQDVVRKEFFGTWKIKKEHELEEKEKATVARKEKAAKIRKDALRALSDIQPRQPERKIAALQESSRSYALPPVDELKEHAMADQRAMEKILSLQAELEEEKQARNDVEDKYSTEASRLEKRNRLLEDEIRNSKIRGDRHSTEISGLRGEVDRLSKENELKSKRIEQLMKDQSFTDDATVSDLRNQLRSTEDSLQAMRMTLSDLKNENERLKTTREKRTTDKDASEGKPHQELADSVRSLQRQLTLADERCGDMKKHIENLQMENASAQKKIVDLEEELQITLASIRDVEQEHGGIKETEKDDSLNVKKEDDHSRASSGRAVKNVPSSDEATEEMQDALQRAEFLIQTLRDELRDVSERETSLVTKNAQLEKEIALLNSSTETGTVPEEGVLRKRGWISASTDTDDLVTREMEDISTFDRQLREADLRAKELEESLSHSTLREKHASQKIHSLEDEIIILHDRIAELELPSARSQKIGSDVREPPKKHVDETSVQSTRKEEANFTVVEDLQRQIAESDRRIAAMEDTLKESHLHETAAVKRVAELEEELRVVLETHPEEEEERAVRVKPRQSPPPPQHHQQDKDFAEKPDSSRRVEDLERELFDSQNRILELELMLKSAEEQETMCTERIQNLEKELALVLSHEDAREQQISMAHSEADHSGSRPSPSHDDRSHSSSDESTPFTKTVSDEEESAPDQNVVGVSSYPSVMERRLAEAQRQIDELGKELEESRERELAASQHVGELEREMALLASSAKTLESSEDDYMRAHSTTNSSIQTESVTTPDGDDAKKETPGSIAIRRNLAEYQKMVLELEENLKQSRENEAASINRIGVLEHELSLINKNVTSAVHDVERSPEKPKLSVSMQTEDSHATQLSTMDTRAIGLEDDLRAADERIATLTQSLQEWQEREQAATKRNQELERELSLIESADAVAVSVEEAGGTRSGRHRPADIAHGVAEQQEDIVSEGGDDGDAPDDQEDDAKSKLAHELLDARNKLFELEEELSEAKERERMAMEKTAELEREVSLLSSTVDTLSPTSPSPHSNSATKLREIGTQTQEEGATVSSFPLHDDMIDDEMKQIRSELLELKRELKETEEREQSACNKIVSLEKELSLVSHTAISHDAEEHISDDGGVHPIGPDHEQENDFKKEMKRLRDKNTSLVAEKKRLEEQIVELEKTVSDLNVKLAGTETREESAMIKVRELESEISLLHRTLESDVGSRPAQDPSIAKKHRVPSVDENVDEKSDNHETEPHLPEEIDRDENEQEREVEKLRDDIIGYAQQVHDAQTRIRELETENHQLSEQEMDAVKKIHQLEHEIELLQLDGTSPAEVLVDRAEDESASQESSRPTRTREKLENEMKQWKEKCDVLEREVSRLRAELHTVKHDLDDQHRQTDVAKSELLGSLSKIQELQHEIDEISRHPTSMGADEGDSITVQGEQSEAERNAENKMLRGEVARVKKHAESLQSDLKTQGALLEKTRKDFNEEKATLEREIMELKDRESACIHRVAELEKELTLLSSSPAMEEKGPMGVEEDVASSMQDGEKALKEKHPAVLSEDNENLRLMISRKDHEIAELEIKLHDLSEQKKEVQDREKEAGVRIQQLEEEIRLVNAANPIDSDHHESNLDLDEIPGGEAALRSLKKEYLSTRQGLLEGGVSLGILNDAFEGQDTPAGSPIPNIVLSMIRVYQNTGTLLGIDSDVEMDSSDRAHKKFSSFDAVGDEESVSESESLKRSLANKTKDLDESRSKVHSLQDELVEANERVHTYESRVALLENEVSLLHKSTATVIKDTADIGVDPIADLVEDHGVGGGHSQMGNSGRAGDRRIEKTTLLEEKVVELEGTLALTQQQLYDARERETSCVERVRQLEREIALVGKVDDDQREDLVHTDGELASGELQSTSKSAEDPTSKRRGEVAAKTKELESQVRDLEVRLTMGEDTIRELQRELVAREEMLKDARESEAHASQKVFELSQELEAVHNELSSRDGYSNIPGVLASRETTGESGIDDVVDDGIDGDNDDVNEEPDSPGVNISVFHGLQTTLLTRNREIADLEAERDALRDRVKTLTELEGAAVARAREVERELELMVATQTSREAAGSTRPKGVSNGHRTHPPTTRTSDVGEDDDEELHPERPDSPTAENESLAIRARLEEKIRLIGDMEQSLAEAEEGLRESSIRETEAENKIQQLQKEIMLLSTGDGSSAPSTHKTHESDAKESKDGYSDASQKGTSQENLRKRVAELQESTNFYKMLVEEREQELQESNRRANDMREQLKDLSEREMQGLRRITLLEEEIQLLSKASSPQSKTNSRTRTKESDAAEVIHDDGDERTIIRLRERVKELQKQLEESVEMYESRLSSLKEHVNQLKKEYSELEGEHSSAKDRVDLLQEELLRMTEHAEQERKSLASGRKPRTDDDGGDDEEIAVALEESHKDSTTKRTSSGRELGDEGSTENAPSVNGHLFEMVNDLQEQVKIERERTMSASAKIESLEDDLREQATFCEKEKSGLQMEIERLKVIVLQRDDNIAQLRRDLSIQKTAVAELNSSASELESALRRIGVAGGEKEKMESPHLMRTAAEVLLSSVERISLLETEVDRQLSHDEDGSKTLLQELQSTKDRLREQEAAGSLLAKQVERLEADVRSEKKFSDGLKETAEKLEAENHRLRQKIEEDAIAESGSREKVLELTRELRNTTQHADETREALAVANERKTKMVSELEDKVRKLERELASSHEIKVGDGVTITPEDVERLQEERASLLAECARLRDDMRQVDDAEEKIKVLRDELSREEEEHRREVDVLSGIISEKAERIRTLEDNYRKLDSQVVRATAAEKLERAELEVTLERERENADGSILKVSELSQELEKQRLHYENELRRCERDATEVRQEAKRLRTDLSAMEERVKMYQKINADLEESARNLGLERSDDVAVGAQKIHEMEQEIERQHLHHIRERDALSAQYKKLQSRLNNLLAEIPHFDMNAGATNEIELLRKLKDEHQSVLDEAAELKTRLVAHEIEYRDVEEKVLVMEAELAQQNRHFETQIGEEKERVRKLQADLQSATQDARGFVLRQFAAQRQEIEDERQATIADRSHLEKEYTVLASEKERYRQMAEQQSEQKDAAIAKVHELQEELERQHEHALSEVRLLTEKNKSLRLEVNAASKRASDAERDRDRLAASPVGKSADDKVLAAREEEFRIAQAKVVQLEQELESTSKFYEKELEDTKRNVSEALQAKHSSRVDELNQRIDVLTKVVDRLESENKALKREVADLRSSKLSDDGTAQSEEKALVSVEGQETSGEKSSPRKPATPSTGETMEERIEGSALKRSETAAAGALSRRPPAGAEEVEEALGRLKSGLTLGGEKGEMRAMRALRQLCEWAPLDVAWRLILRRDGLDALIQTLYLKNIEVQRFGVQLLSILSFDDDAEVEVRAKGGIPPVVKLLDSPDSLTAVHAISCVRSLAVNEDNVKEFVRLGVVPVLLSHVKESIDERARRDAVKGIRSIAFSAIGKEEVRKNGGVSILLNCLANRDLEVVRAAIRGIMVLSVLPEVRVEIRTREGIPPILRCLEISQTDIVRSSVGTLINVSVNAKNKDAIRSAGGLPLLVRLLNTTQDNETKKYLVRTIANLAISDTNKRELQELAAVPALARYLFTSDPVTVRFGMRCLSLFAQNDDAARDIIDGNFGAILAPIDMDDGGVVREIINALNVLSRYDRMLQMLVDAKVVGKLTRMMVPFLLDSDDASSSAVAIRTKSLSLMQRMASVPAARPAMLKENLLKHTFNLLMMRDDDGEYSWRRSGLALLVELSQSDECKQSVQSLDGFTKLAASLKDKLAVNVVDALRVTFQLSSEEVNRSAVRQARMIPLILGHLKSPETVVVRHAIKAVFAISVSDENEVEIKKLGGIRSVLDCLYKDDVEIQRLAVGAICNLSVNDGNKQEIHKQKGVKPILALCEASDEKTRREAVRAIRNLSFNEKCKADISSMGGVELLLRLLRASDPIIVRYAMRSLSILSIDVENRALIHHPDGLRNVISCLSSTDPETTRAAAGALINLSINRGHKDGVRQAGGIFPLLKVVDSSDPDTSKYALRALYNLTINEANQKELVSFGGVATAIRHLDPTSDRDARHFAMSLLTNLMTGAQGKADLLRRGLAGDVMMYMFDDDRRIRVGCLKLLAQLAADEKLAKNLQVGGLVKKLMEYIRGKDSELLVLSLRIVRVMAYLARYEIRDIGLLEILVDFAQSSDLSVKTLANESIVALEEDPGIRLEVQRIVTAPRVLHRADA
eukprot:TRINITY_DN1443_c0_g1_i1.p1 TRINITY_DN1443_c0_g1~~TRINITY_DN1443_c0_g1_i1.p1  ORF type:complete len:4732 (-),score=1609.03 TRINITY_DN1443_c0_g1_i1:184-14379(-)